MDIKKVAQYGLLLLLIITSFLFYYQYFSDENKTIFGKQVRYCQVRECPGVTGSDWK